MQSLNVKSLLKCFISSEKFSELVLLCQTQLFFFFLVGSLKPWLPIAALFSWVYVFLGPTLYSLTRNCAVTVGDGKEQRNLFFKQCDHLR